MANSPSQRWENGVLVERALSTPAGDVEDEEMPVVTGRPNDVAGPNSTFSGRAETRTKQISGDQAENKAVSPARAVKK